MSSAPRVDFYILEASEAGSRLRFACRLTEKAYSQNTAVYAHTDSPATAQRFDDMLWTFRQGSFIPHQLLSATPDRRAPVSIGTDNDNATSGELLINLTDRLPGFANGFQRVAEVICGDEASRQAGRDRFKAYRDMGIEPETHHIAS